MALSVDRRAALVQLAARATSGIPVSASNVGALKAWRADANEAEAAQIDALLDPDAPEPDVAYTAGQRRAAVYNAEQGGAA